MNSTETLLEFFDCNTWIGRPMNLLPGRPNPPGCSAEYLISEMDKAGISKALVWHVAQRDSFPATGNDLLIEAIAGSERLVPCWTLLPPQTRELGDLDSFFGQAGKAGVKAFRVFPDIHRFLLRRTCMCELFDRMVVRRIPLILRVPGNVDWSGVYDLLSETPELTVILSNMGSWGSDRFFRPLIEDYPNVYIETSGYITDGGIEAFVESYGSQRLLFGTNFPEAYHGAMMLSIAHAEISHTDKEAIACGNLDRLLRRVKL